MATVKAHFVCWNCYNRFEEIVDDNSDIVIFCPECGAVLTARDVDFIEQINTKEVEMKEEKA